MASTVDLDITHEEVERITKALKDEKFRKLFAEYAQEISDPVNRQKYEEEIAQLERNRGKDVVFVHPEPGYVMKTNVDGEQKAFINVCMSDKVARPKAKQVRNNEGKPGTQWSLPHSLAPPREDLDKGSKKCIVYDCVFHPVCFKNGEADPRFLSLMNDTAVNGIESNFNVKLDRENIKKMSKLKFKGQQRATVIRTDNPNGPTGETDALKDFQVDYPFNDKHANTCTDVNAKITGSRNIFDEEVNRVPVEPKYTIVHRGHFDLQHFTNAPDAMPTTRPQELVIKIQLPLLKSIATLQLDVFKKQIVLECHKPASYKLDLPLPYLVNEDLGIAKFDKTKCCLTITLPVVPPQMPMLPSFAPDKPVLIGEIPSKSLEESDIQFTGPLGENAVPIIHNEQNISNDEVTSKIENQDIVQTTEVSSCVVAEETTVEEQCPRYSFRQDETTVTFIIQVACIDVDHFRKQVAEGSSSVCLTFSGTDDNCQEEAVMTHYSLCIVFEAQYQFQDVTVDFTKTEAVLLLNKATICHGEWASFTAGVDMDNLEKKLFLTDVNVRQHLGATTNKHNTNQDKSGSLAAGSGGIVCEVTEASDSKLVIELESKVNVAQETAPNSSEVSATMSEEDIAEAALGQVTNTVIDAVIGELSNAAASLKLHIDQTNFDLSASSGGSTPCSPSGLKSVLREGGNGRRQRRSVSFSEDVVVETMVSTKSPRKPKGGGKNKRYQPPRPKRFITKLRDGSQHQGTSSDTEIRYWCGDSEEEGAEFLEEVIFPSFTVSDRPTSSDSSSGEGNGSLIHDANKKKKPKANKRQRKKLNTAKRGQALCSDDDVGDMKEAWFEPSDSLHPKTLNGNHHTPNMVPKSLQSPKRPHDNLIKNAALLSKANTAAVEKATEQDKTGDIDEKVKDKTNVKQNDDNVPLEWQDHRTSSAFNFSNVVMFELDE